MRMQIVIATAVLTATLAFSGCGASSSQTNLTGPWLWAESPAVGQSATVEWHASLSQTDGSVTGTKTGPDPGITCTLSGTLSGRSLQIAAASPCNQTFSLAVRPDNSLQGTGQYTGGMQLLVSAVRDHT
jgi:hypothetical protein